MKTHAWPVLLHWVCWTAFMVLCLACIVNTRQSIEVATLGSGTIAPENLKRSNDLLRTGIVVEQPGFPVEQLVSSHTFREHEARLAAYAARLELLERQNRERGLWLSGLTLAAALCLLLTTFLQMKKRPEPAPEPSPASRLAPGGG